MTPSRARTATRCRVSVMARFFHIVACRPIVATVAGVHDEFVTMTEATTGAHHQPQPKQKIHRAWWVAVVAFVAILGAAGFRATPSVLITPLQAEFGWSRGVIS